MKRTYGFAACNIKFPEISYSVQRIVNTDWLREFYCSQMFVYPCRNAEAALAYITNEVRAVCSLRAPRRNNASQLASARKGRGTSKQQYARHAYFMYHTWSRMRSWHALACDVTIWTSLHPAVTSFLDLGHEHIYKVVHIQPSIAWPCAVPCQLDRTSGYACALFSLSR